jgi:hypothetical protein
MVHHTIQYLYQWEPLKRTPLLKMHGGWLWDSVTIEQHLKCKPWKHLAQAFTNIPRSKSALSAEYVLQARNMGKVRDTTPHAKSITLTFLQRTNVLGNNADGSFVLVVENNIGWVSKDAAKEIDDLTKDLTEAREWLAPWAFITGPLSQVLIYFGSGKRENFCRSKKMQPIEIRGLVT